MYRDKYLKYKSKYNNLKLLGGSPETVYYSNDNDTYLQGTYHQLAAIKIALLKNYSDNSPYIYNNPPIKFYLYPFNLDKLIFLCVNENKTFLYLKYQPATKLIDEEKKEKIEHFYFFNKPATKLIDKEKTAYPPKDRMVELG